MQNYEGAKQDFAVRAGLVNRQCLFSGEQLAVIQNACEFSLEEDITLSYVEEKLLRSVQEQIEQLLPEQEQEQPQQPAMEQSRDILEAAFLLQEKGPETVSKKTKRARCIIS